MLKILARGKKKAYVSIGCLFWKDSVQNTEKTRVIPIDLAGFEWNPKCLILNSSEAWASVTGKSSQATGSSFLSYPCPAVSLLLQSFCSSSASCMARAGETQTIPLWILADRSVPFLLHLPHWETPRLRFKLSSGEPSWETWYCFLAGPFSDTLFQTHPVPIATLGSNWDALHYFFHSSGTWV